MNKSFTLAVLALLLTISTYSAYTASSPVTQLTAKDFDKVYKGIWLV